MFWSRDYGQSGLCHIYGRNLNKVSRHQSVKVLALLKPHCVCVGCCMSEHTTYVCMCVCMRWPQLTFITVVHQVTDLKFTNKTIINAQINLYLQGYKVVHFIKIAYHVLDMEEFAIHQCGIIIIMKHFWNIFITSITVCAVYKPMHPHSCNNCFYSG